MWLEKQRMNEWVDDVAALLWLLYSLGLLGENLKDRISEENRALLTFMSVTSSEEVKKLCLICQQRPLL